MHLQTQLLFNDSHCSASCPGENNSGMLLHTHASSAWYATACAMHLLTQPLCQHRLWRHFAPAARNNTCLAAVTAKRCCWVLLRLL
jgi:hypothetical protein